VSPAGGSGAAAFGAAARHELADALARGAPLRCPECQLALTWQEVRPAEGVPYVRRRIWVMCPGCRRTAALDRPAG